jgi:hypothetical protein
VQPGLPEFASFPWTIKINGQAAHSMNANRISLLIPKPGEIEHWTYINGGGGWDHPIHLHFEEGVTIDRGADTIPATEKLVRKDVWRLRPSGRVKFQIQFGEFGGSYVNHCHNTVHEDFAMLMRIQLLTGQVGYTAGGVHLAPDSERGRHIELHDAGGPQGRRPRDAADRSRGTAAPEARPNRIDPDGVRRRGATRSAWLAFEPRQAHRLRREWPSSLVAVSRETQASRWGSEYVPNVPVVTQDGKVLNFYDDLIKTRSSSSASCSRVVAMCARLRRREWRSCRSGWSIASARRSSSIRSASIRDTTRPTR